MHAPREVHAFDVPYLLGYTHRGISTKQCNKCVQICVQLFDVFIG